VSRLAYALLWPFSAWWLHRQHRRCLARIARLESTLFPAAGPIPARIQKGYAKKHWPKEFGPGQRWRVSSAHALSATNMRPVLSTNYPQLLPYSAWGFL